MICPANAIEVVYRQFRKLTQAKSAFPNENSLLRLFAHRYLADLEREFDIILAVDLFYRLFSLHYVLNNELDSL